jgi:hypothetical protein
MRSVVATEPGVVELNFLWLPTFIGMNGAFKEKMERDLAEKVQGMTMDDKGLDRAHEIVVEYIVKAFPQIRGLGRYLDSMKYLELP